MTRKPLLCLATITIAQFRNFRTTFMLHGESRLLIRSIQAITIHRTLKGHIAEYLYTAVIYRNPERCVNGSFPID